MQEKHDLWPPQPTVASPQSGRAVRPPRAGLARASAALAGLALLSVLAGRLLAGRDLIDLALPVLYGGFVNLMPLGRLALGLILTGTLVLSPVGLVLGLASRSRRAGAVGAGVGGLLLLWGLSYLLQSMYIAARAVGYV